MKKRDFNSQTTKGDNFILTIYYYFTVNVLHIVVISPFVFRELKTHFFGSPYVYLYIKNIWLTRHKNVIICTRDTLMWQLRYGSVDCDSGTEII